MLFIFLWLFTILKVLEKNEDVKNVVTILLGNWKYLVGELRTGRLPKAPGLSLQTFPSEWVWIYPVFRKLATFACHVSQGKTTKQILPEPVDLLVHGQALRWALST